VNDRKDWDDTVSELKEDDGACWRERMKKMCERVLKDAWPGWTMGGDFKKKFPQRGNLPPYQIYYFTLKKIKEIILQFQNF